MRARRPVARPTSHRGRPLVLRSIDREARAAALAGLVEATGRLVAKAKPRVRDGLPEGAQRAVRRHTDRLPKDRPLTRSELDDFVRALSHDVGEELWQEYQRGARRTYVFGLEDVNRATGAELQFGGVHPGVLRALLLGEHVSEAFQGVTQETAGAITGVLRDEMMRGVTAPGRIARRMEDEVRGISRRRLETIARTENYRILETAHAVAYREAEVRRGEAFQYGWGRDLGPTRLGNPQCVICTEIIDGIPSEGLSLDALIEFMKDTIKRHKPKWDPTLGNTFPNPHSHCRHSLRRIVVPLPKTT